MLGSTAILTSALLLLSGVVATASAPTAETLNGTYAGVYSARFDQGFFLGIPYLQAPIDDRRFHPADSLTSSWNGTRNATAYAPSCVGYDTTVDAREMAEDCLYLNVIRPHSVTDASNLPSTTTGISAPEISQTPPVLGRGHCRSFFAI